MTDEGEPLTGDHVVTDKGEPLTGDHVLTDKGEPLTGDHVVTDEGEPMTGGFASVVHRVGDTVRRTPPERADFAHASSTPRGAWLGRRGAVPLHERPRPRGPLVRRGPRSALTPPERAALATPDTVLAIGELLRELHDLTAGSALAGDREVVCHNDLSPKNTVYRDGRPVAFLDWDLAAPDDRIADVAHCCWQFPELGPQLSDPAAAGRLVRAVADGYRLADRGPLVDRILRWQQDCWLGIAAGIAAGDPRFGRLRDADAVRHVRAEQRRTQAHRAAMYSALTG